MIQLISLTRGWASNIPYTAKPVGRDYVLTEDMVAYKGFIAT